MSSLPGTVIEVRLIWYFFCLDLESAAFPESLGPFNGKWCLETMICALDVFTASGDTAWKSFKEPASKPTFLFFHHLFLLVGG